MGWSGVGITVTLRLENSQDLKLEAVHYADIREKSTSGRGHFRAKKQRLELA